MGRTFIKTFSFNYKVSSSSEDYNYLEEAVDKYLGKHPNLIIKQMEFLWGDRYGARMAVLFEEES